MINNWDRDNRWEIKSLGDIAELIKPGIKKFVQNKHYVKTGNIDDSKILSTDIITYEDRPNRADMEVQEGDVLFARMQSTNKVFLVTSKETGYIFSTGFAVVRPKLDKIEPKFLAFYFKSKYFQSEKDKVAHGATQKAINNSDILKIRGPASRFKDTKADSLQFRADGGVKAEA
jgi:Restriction endonuclease S subunits